MLTDCFFADMAFRCILFLLPAKYNNISFVASGTITSAANERSQLQRKSLLSRLLSVDMILYALYIVYASIPLLLRLDRYRKCSETSAIFSPFPGIWIKLIDCVFKMAVPLRYMIWPPTVPDWNDLVVEDEEGVKRPKREWERGGVGNATFWVWMNACEWVVICLCGWR